MAAMTFLECCQTLRLECGVSGSGPSSVKDHTGEMARLVHWVRQAWNDIQNRHTTWRWMQGTVQFATVANQATYTPDECGVEDLAQWKKQSFRIYRNDIGTRSERFLGWKEYDFWRDLYQFGSLRESYGPPVVITTTPDRSLGLGLIPDSALYTVVGEYFKSTTTLTENGDTPGMPERFHMAIVYHAMMAYGAFESAPEVYQRGKQEFDRLYGALEIDQLPTVQFGRALA